MGQTVAAGVCMQIEEQWDCGPGKRYYGHTQDHHTSRQYDTRPVAVHCPTSYRRENHRRHSPHADCTGNQGATPAKFVSYRRQENTQDKHRGCHSCKYGGTCSEHHDPPIVEGQPGDAIPGDYQREIIQYPEPTRNVLTNDMFIYLKTSCLTNSKTKGSQKTSESL